MKTRSNTIDNGVRNTRVVMPRLFKLRVWAICLALAMLGTASSEAAIYNINGDLNDALIGDTNNDGIGDAVGDVTQPEITVGFSGGGGAERASVFPFALPSLTGQTIISATLTLGLRHKFNPNTSGDLYGLTRTSATSPVVTGDYFAGVLDGANTLLMNNFVTNNFPVNGNTLFMNEPHSVSGAGLISFLTAQSTALGGPGFIFFRVSPDGIELPSGTVVGFPSNDQYSFNAADSLTVGDFLPFLTFETESPVPEPTSFAMLGLGALVVLWRRKSAGRME